MSLCMCICSYIEFASVGSVSIAPVTLLAALPRLRPRYYSASSSSAATPRILSITALIVSHPSLRCDWSEAHPLAPSSSPIL
jgi:sulfite reductase alpha subunit-like flavoprotein